MLKIYFFVMLGVGQKLIFHDDGGRRGEVKLMFHDEGAGGRGYLKIDFALHGVDGGPDPLPPK